MPYSKDFLSRAKSICSAEYLAEEINFIKNVFVENGYKVHHLNKIVEDLNKSKHKNTEKEQKFTSLPWIPEISNKLKKVFKEARCQIAFKSPTNLNSLLGINRSYPRIVSQGFIISQLVLIKVIRGKRRIK